MAVPDPEDWPLLAKCRGMNDALFPEGKDQKRAKTICMGCPVRAQCLAEALDNRIEWGVWGVGSPLLKQWERRASGRRPLPIGS